MPTIPKVILLLESSRASGRDLLRGIARYARLHGPWAFYWEPGGLEKAWPRIRTLDAQGIILRDVEQVNEVRALGIPAIVVGHSRKEVRGLPNVVTDSATIGRLGAEHLLDCGFRQFAFCGYPGVPWSERRGEAFQRRVAEAGGTTHFFGAEPPASGLSGKEQPRRWASAPRSDERSNTSGLSWKAELQELEQWLRSLPKPVGLMACNDDRAQHVIEACKMAGLRVPDEVAVVGADNDELVCELSDPPLSSVRIHFERAGFESAQLLDRLMRGQRVRELKILVAASGVVPRRSSDVRFIEDPHLARALRFVRDHAAEPLRVPAVAQAAGLSRRALEKRFRAQLGRSILQEIRRVRVERISRLLLETNQSVSEIALSLGYTGVEHFARYFRREKGMTPLAFRQRFGA